MNTKYVVCNTSWMREYRGVRGGKDKASGGGSYVVERGRGHEEHNFKAIGGKYYGYVSPHGSVLNMNMLGASSKDKSVTGVTVIWTATRPGYSPVVVGWYKNAKAFRNEHDDPHVHFFVARRSDSRLLEVSNRTLRVPRGKGAMGQSNVWYAQTPRGERFLEQVKKLMSGRMPAPTEQRRPHGRWQQDLAIRLRVERAAVRTVARWYEGRGYEVDDVHREKRGWDIEARRDGWIYRLEVKGLSGPFDAVELTPNEFAAMQRYKDSFNLCVVSNLSGRRTQKLQIFEYTPEDRCWVTANGGRLKVEELKVVSARCSPG